MITKGQVKAFSQQFPSKNVLVLGRYEEEELNCSKIDKVLFKTKTPHVSVTLRFNPQNMNLIRDPKFKAEQKINVSIEKASMFVAAKFNDTWKGVRISKL